MRIKLTKIGNSWGIRLPKNVINECEFKNELNLSVEQKRVILTAIHQERAGWREKIAENGENKCAGYEEEWQW